MKEEKGGCRRRRGRESEKEEGCKDRRFTVGICNCAFFRAEGMWRAVEGREGGTLGLGQGCAGEK